MFSELVNDIFWFARKEIGNSGVIYDIIFSVELFHHCKYCKESHTTLNIIRTFPCMQYLVCHAYCYLKIKVLLVLQSGSHPCFDIDRLDN